mmetsp:Transcript_26216/g.67667  ORF Transcript_26216/g.67667 Transcript_26216/m.67667 type:complete len:278 (+) Transcript_26216:57-890(+)
MGSGSTKSAAKYQPSQSPDGDIVSAPEVADSQPPPQLPSEEAIYALDSDVAEYSVAVRSITRSRTHTPVTAPGHGFSTGHRVKITGIIGGRWPELVNKEHVVTAVSDDVFTIPVDTSCESGDGVVQDGACAVWCEEASGAYSVAVTGLARGNPTIVVAPAHGFCSGHCVTLSGVGGAGWGDAVHGDHEVTKVSEDEFSVPVDTTMLIGEALVYEDTRAIYTDDLQVTDYSVPVLRVERHPTDTRVIAPNHGFSTGHLVMLGGITGGNWPRLRIAVMW